MTDVQEIREDPRLAVDGPRLPASRGGAVERDLMLLLVAREWRALRSR